MPPFWCYAAGALAACQGGAELGQKIAAVALCPGSQVQPFVEAEHQKGGFGAGLAALQALRLQRGRVPGLHGMDVGLGLLQARTALAVHPGPRAGAKAQGVVVEPVEPVVHGFAAGQGEVGDLVLGQAGLAQGLDPALVHLRLGLVVGHRQLALGRQMAEAGARLDGEAIEGHVLWAALQGPRQALLPVLGALAAEAEHEVQADVVEAGAAGGVPGLVALPGAVDAPQGLQVSVLGGLKAEADAVEAPLPQLPELGRIGRARVHLAGHLGPGRQAEGVGRRLQQLQQLLGLQQRRRAAAEVDRAQALGQGPGALGGAEGDLFGQGGHVCRR
jgi:hypothetical protein